MEMETMSASSKRARAGGDRLSDLPDCLLDIILSHLGSRQVVQTSALSRRWRHLWRTVPWIDIDQREFIADGADAEADIAGAETAAERRRLIEAKWEREDDEWSRFEDFADNVLARRDEALPPDTFRLHIAKDRYKMTPGRWIRRGLASRPAALHVSCAYRPFDSMDGPIFSFRTGFGAGAGGSTGRLRKLHLLGLRLARDFADVISSECPVLEDVQLVSCECYFEPNRIASGSLKSLAIDRHSGYRKNPFALAAPRLVLLDLGVTEPGITSEVEMPSLVKASITGEIGELGFLKSLRSARILELTRFTTKALLTEEPGEFPMFHNLTTLTLDRCDIGDDCQVLRHFLQNAPNLERLKLRYCKFSGNSKSKEEHARCNKTSVSGCGDPTFYDCKNLESIEIEYDHNEHMVPDVLAQVLTDISKDVVHPITSSTDNGNCTVKILYM